MRRSGSCRAFRAARRLVFGEGRCVPRDPVEVTVTARQTLGSDGPGTGETPSGRRSLGRLAPAGAAVMGQRPLGRSRRRVPPRTTSRGRRPSGVWHFARADVPSSHNRRWIVAAGADDRPRTHPSFIAHSFRSAPASPPRAPAPWCDPLWLVRERAVRARPRVIDHPTCTGVNHEPTAQPPIPEQRLPRSAHPAEAGHKLAHPPRPSSTRERIRGRGGPRAPLRGPDRG